MDPQTKSAIKSLVLDLRHTLEDELAILLRRYGLFTDRDWSLEEPPARLADPAEREIWQRVVAVVQRSMKEGRTLPQATADYVRESAFTFLNRIVGLKCLEVRAIIDEVITTREIYGGRSQAHRDYRDEHPRQARAADDALPACLAAACQRVNDEMIGYLFDPDDDHSLAWPRYAVLRTCIEKINALAESVWKEDEIIGWIYQFYNAEEKVAVRKRGKPRTPHDVAVINQFFTPRWIVKFLVDNTLGRLWLEMHPDSERVREKCTYLVPEPLPDQQTGEPANQQIGKSANQQEASGQADKVADLQTCRFALDPDSPINNPHAVPRRPEKPIIHIRLIDPACGTMHFGHYACEVFDCMYRDARDWGHVQIEDHEIPTAILEHNLFGVDIDRRAVQLAALSLFMKARTMHPQARVRQVNLVVADATLPDSGIKEKFLARYAKDKAVQKAFAQVLDDMDQVAQVGSLLRVEERLRELLAKAGHAAVREGLGTLRRQRELPGFEPEVRQMGLAELVEEEEATAWTPHYTLQELRDDLRAFAREALDEHDVNAQLFATEADKAARLLDVLMGEYDVVVMNPPYGYTTKTAKPYIRSNYPDTYNDLYAAFIERSFDLAAQMGYVGALTSRSFMFLTTFQSLREKVLLRKHILTLAELGIGILDGATVRVAAQVVENSEVGVRTPLSVFFGLRDKANRHTALKEAVRALWEKDEDPITFLARQQGFEQLPQSNFAYWVSESLIHEFQILPPLDKDVAGLKAAKIADVKVGLQTGSDKTFVRYFWEVPSEEIEQGEKWVPFSKGGMYSPYYGDLDLVVFWIDEGKHIKNLVDENGRQRSRPQNEEFYFLEGLTYPATSEKGMGVQYLPSGTIPSVKGSGIYLKNKRDIWYLLGVLNSRLLYGLLRTFTVDRERQVGMIASLPIAEPARPQHLQISNLARGIYDLKAAWDISNEICTRFTQPWLMQTCEPANQQISGGGTAKVLALLDKDAPDIALPESTTLQVLLDSVRAIEQAADARLQALQAQIDDAVYDLYEISPADRALIEREMGDRPPELVWPQMEGNSDKEKRHEHVRRLFSYYALQAVRADEDGVVPLAGCAAHEPYLVDRVRAQLEAQFDPDVAYQIEQDAAEYLGRPLEDWLHRYFFHRFHAKLYKKRPILWHLASPRGYFAVMLDYHRLSRDTLPKVRTLYLWPQMEEVRTRLAAARADESVKAVADLEDELADLEDCDRRLESVIQGTVEVGLPEWANGPYRDGAAPYDPDIDDGVKVNLLPVQKAGLLPVKRVV